MPDTSKINMDSSLLDGLSEQERKVLLKTLSEMSVGDNSLLNELKYADYKEIPVSIEEFITNDLYLGKAWKTSEGKSKIFPYWEKVAKNLFPTNTDTKVNNAIFSGARGLGKSEWAITFMLYLMYRIMCLKDPHSHYNLKPTEKICFAFMNITKTLAEDIGISKFQETVKSSTWFLSHGKLTGRDNIMWEPPDPIHIIIGSQSSHVIGQPIMAAFFDEISFIRHQDIDKQKSKAIDMIDTAIGGMKTRFINKGKNPTLLILASSKRSEKSFLEEHMKKKLQSEKENVLIVDEPVWNVRPPSEYSGKKFNLALGNKFLMSQVLEDDDDVNLWINRGYKILHIPIEFRANFLDDIDRALCDFAGVSSSEISKYISGAAVSEIKNTERSNPFIKDIIEVGNAPDDTSQYYDFFDLEKINKELLNKPLYIHLDMSISGDMTGIAGVWISGKKTSVSELNQSKDLFYTLAFSVSIKAPKGRQISFEKNRNFIYWLKDRGFKIKSISTDTFQSADFGQIVSSKGYNYKVLSVDRVDSDHICKPYQYLRSTIYEKRIDIYDSQELTSELVDLERNINTGKIDHPSGGKKDISDALAGAVYMASQDAEQYAYDYGEDLGTVLDTNKVNQSLPQAKRQVSIEFEKELQNILSPNSIKKAAENEKIKYKNTPYENMPIVHGGMLIW